MMKKMILRSVSLTLLLVAPIAFAHGGHDHSHWSSGIIHAVWISATIAVFAISALVLKNRAKLKNTKNQSKEG